MKISKIFRYLAGFLALHLIFYGFTGLALWGTNLTEIRGIILTGIHAVTFFVAVVTLVES